MSMIHDDIVKTLTAQELFELFLERVTNDNQLNIDPDIYLTTNGIMVYLIRDLKLSVDFKNSKLYAITQYDH